MSRLLTTLARWRPFSAVVFGDFMLDELVYGDAERMSPDAPAPVLRVLRREHRPGGAANVCLDLAALGGRVRAVGAIGDDDAGQRLRAALQEAGVDGSALLCAPGRPTTLKRSLIGLAQHRHPQKMLRMDEESRDPIDAHLEAELMRALDDRLDGADVLCLEDYAKGVCSSGACPRAIERARSKGVASLMDPSLGAPLSRYAGCTAFTPNRTEAEVSLGAPIDPDASSPDADRAARELLARLEAEAVAITLDKHGAILAERQGEAEPAVVRVPTRAREVYDVSGAGDMVLAALAAGRANGLSWTDALRFANAAAGLEVEVFGVQPIPFERVHRAVMLEARARGSKQRSLEEALVEAAALRREAMSIVFTNGCFDILHAGHIALLRRAREQGDALFVGLNDDESVRRLKGPGRPVHCLADRVAILSELVSVDVVIPFAEDTPIPLMQALRPDVLVKGADYSKAEVVGADLVEGWGGRVVLAPLLDGRSTSQVVERLSASPATTKGAP